MTKMCPFRKEKITYSYICHEGKRINVPLMDSEFTVTEEEFCYCLKRKCIMFVDTRAGGYCSLGDNK